MEKTFFLADWGFATDPEDIGIDEGWYLSGFEDDSWQRLAPGESWESNDVAYDGVAWYRAEVELPDWDFVYLSFGKPDDAATLWIDDVQVGAWTLNELGSRPVLLNLLDFGSPGEVLSLVFRIEDQGGDGGLTVPLRWGTDPRLLMDEMQYISWLAHVHPNWPMPEWTRGEPFGWTMIGGLGEDNEALLSSNGALAPQATSPTVEVWLYDPQSGELTGGAGHNRRFSLVEGALPIPQVAWEAFDTALQTTSFYDRQEQAVRWLVNVSSTAEARRDLTLIVAVRPFGVNKAVAPIQSIAFQDGDRLLVNDHPFLVAGTLPEETGVGFLPEMMDAAAHGVVPDTDQLACASRRDAMALLSYPLELDAGESLELQFALPSVLGWTFPETAVDVALRLEETIGIWDAATSEVAYDLPDAVLEQIVQASTGYLLLAIDSDGPHPGPLAHDSVWVRDAAYIGLALLQTGHSDVVQRYIPLILATQEADGKVPPIYGEDIPWDDEEWDAQGQFIFLMTSYYRYTSDLASLRSWYPALRDAAQFLVDLRAPMVAPDGDDGAVSDPTNGLLPPSKSAEDLGPASWHHYWDNFWTVAGLEEAAYAAQVLGELDDAAWMQAEADALREAILASLEVLMGPDPEYIPGAVENLGSSAMARGSVPVLWPVEVLPRESSLLARSFEHYYQLWIAPSGGGFRHYSGHYWPYGGLELAHAYLRLGRIDVVQEILAWTSAHQTLPGTFAWAEQVSPWQGGFSGGDMPHAWMAAGYTTLVREMLISEREGALELFSGVPVTWFAEGETIALQDLPTHYGLLTLVTESTVSQNAEVWQGELELSISGAMPPEGFRWHLPDAALESLEDVAGPSGTQIQAGWLVIPSQDGVVRLTFGH